MPNSANTNQSSFSTQSDSMSLEGVISSVTFSDESNACAIVSSPQEGYYLNDCCLDESDMSYFCDGSPREGSLICLQSVVQSDRRNLNFFTFSHFLSMFPKNAAFSEYPSLANSGGSFGATFHLLCFR